MDSGSNLRPMGAGGFASVRSDRRVSTRIGHMCRSLGTWRMTCKDSHPGRRRNSTCLSRVVSKGAALVALCLASVTTPADEQRFGNWRGQIDIAGSYPVSIQADHFEGDMSSSMVLMCRPAGWIDQPNTRDVAPEGLSPPDQPRYGGVLMDTSSTTSLEREAKPCVVEAKGVARDGDEHVVRSKGLCQGSGVDAGKVDEWSDILDLLTSAPPLSDARPRITVHRHDGSSFTFVAPKVFNTSMARTWMDETCKRLRRTDGRVIVPGPTYGVWLTQYTYDEFYEKKLVGNIRAGTASGANEVDLGCGGTLFVGHRTEDCGRWAEADGGLESCRIAVRVNDGSPVEQEAVCKSLCAVMAFSTDGDVVAAMLAGTPNHPTRKRAKMRVSGANDMHRRDFELSLWGFDHAHCWVSSECATASDG